MHRDVTERLQLLSNYFLFFSNLMSTSKLFIVLVLYFYAWHQFACNFTYIILSAETGLVL